MRQIAPRISVDEKVAFGKPVIRGTRVPVALILGKLAGGMAFAELAAEYALDREDILAALSYASQILNEEQVRAIA